MLEMFEHWRRMADMLGTPMMPLVAGNLVNEAHRKKMIPNFRAQWCTRKLKIEPYQASLGKLVKQYRRGVSCVGIRADEPEHKGGDYSVVIGVESQFPMREWGWGINEVMGYLDKRGVVIRDCTDCALCFFQRLGEWWDLWKFRARKSKNPLATRSTATAATHGRPV